MSTQTSNNAVAVVTGATVVNGQTDLNLSVTYRESAGIANKPNAKGEVTKHTFKTVVKDDSRDVHVRVVEKTAAYIASQIAKNLASKARAFKQGKPLTGSDLAYLAKHGKTTEAEILACIPPSKAKKADVNVSKARAKALADLAALRGETAQAAKA